MKLTPGQESSVRLDHKVGNGPNGHTAGKDGVLDIDHVELPAEQENKTYMGSPKMTSELLVKRLDLSKFQKHPTIDTP